MAESKKRSLSSGVDNVSSFYVKRVLLLACVSILVSGCGGSFDAESAIKQVNSTNAQKLVSLYQHYQRRHRGKGPKDEEDFRKFIAGTSTYLLDRIDIDPNSLDGLFISERDNQPLTIRYGLKGNDRGPSIPTVFEVEGADGVRIVACTNMVTKEVEDESEYQDLLKSKGLPVEMQ